MAILGPSTVNVMIAIGIVYIPVFARIVRGTVLAVRENDYVEAARATGQRELRIIWRHVLPNAMDAIIVQISLALACSRVDDHPDPVPELRRIFEEAKKEYLVFQQFLPTRANPAGVYDRKLVDEIIARRAENDRRRETA